MADKEVTTLKKADQRHKLENLKIQLKEKNQCANLANNKYKSIKALRLAAIGSGTPQEEIDLLSEQEQSALKEVRDARTILVILEHQVR